jgi:hypothetical protein
MTMDEVTWICTASAWEDSDCVVSIRPSFEPVWHDVPIGSCLSRRDAEIVARWLNEGGLSELWKIAENVERAKQNGEWPPTKEAQ